MQSATTAAALSSHLPVRQEWLDRRRGSGERAQHHREDIRAAVQREKNLKHWPRAWKVDLIVAENPTWSDLYDKLA
jgi:predicted GIY-YIG superfamily endonuclease